MAHRFEVAGLWGGGNTLTERSLLYEGTNTVYTTWDGTGLLGPNEGVAALEKYNAIWGVLTWQAFYERYDYLADEHCAAWTGQEELGIGCEESCTRFVGMCNNIDAPQCMKACNRWPRTLVSCLDNLAECDMARCDIRLREPRE